MIGNTWGTRLRQVFGEIPDPVWRDGPRTPGALRLETKEYAPVRAPLPPGQQGGPGAEPGLDVAPSCAPIQLVAQQQRGKDSPR